MRKTRHHLSYLNLDLVITATEGLQRTIFSPSDDVVSVEHHGSEIISLRAANNDGDSPIVFELVKLVTLRCQFR
jgi:hypothetical protein